MTLGEKLKKLRTDNGLTQEELAEKLYVTRTAISKWESDRGYPSIDALKAISKFFSVSIDDLLSSDELLTIAEEDSREKETHLKDSVYALLDLSAGMLLFLPLFAENAEGVIQSVSLISLDGIQLYLKAAYFALVMVTFFAGVLALALQNCQKAFWLKSKTNISLLLGLASVLLFVVSSQPYAAVFAIALLAIKVFLLIKRR
jgi:transcriptional regulator with XRE-family HTH domain